MGLITEPEVVVEVVDMVELLVPVVDEVKSLLVRRNPRLVAGAVATREKGIPLVALVLSLLLAVPLPLPLLLGLLDIETVSLSLLGEA